MGRVLFRGNTEAIDAKWKLDDQVKTVNTTKDITLEHYSHQWPAHIVLLSILTIIINKNLLQGFSPSASVRTG